jgi:hypothetical protein
MSTLIGFSEQYKSRRPTFCNFLRPVTSSSVDLNIIINLFPDIPHERKYMDPTELNLVGNWYITV